MTPAWPAFDSIVAAPARTGSVIVTIYGDAILPRGGAWALGDLLALLDRLGMQDGMVRTAVSRLARDGLLAGQRLGRRSAYAITPRGEAEFTAAIPRIYGPRHTAWPGHLTLAFPEPGADRSPLDHAGFALLAPGVLLAPAAAPDSTLALAATGDPANLVALARRAWPLDDLAAHYEAFTARFAPLHAQTPPRPIDAMAARIVLIHAWRRIALRDPRLPSELLPGPWPGDHAYALCRTLYQAWSEWSEDWLDTTIAGPGPLPSGPDPATRFGRASSSGGDTPPEAPASSPEPAGSPRPPRSAAT